MLFNIVNPKGENQEVESEESDEESQNQKQSPRNRIKNAQKSKLRLFRRKCFKEESKCSIQNVKDVYYFKVSLKNRESHEVITQLKGMCPGHRIPMGLLMEGQEALFNGKEINTAVTAFRKAKKWDIINEKRPDENSINQPNTSIF